MSGNIQTKVKFFDMGRNFKTKVEIYRQKLKIDKWKFSDKN
jgi:hypothetical protein